MNAEDREVLRDIVKGGVGDAVEPIWEKIRDHDTALALLKQDAGQCKTSQIAQGTRLGVVETRGNKHSMYWKIFWVCLGIAGGVVGLVATLMS